LKEFLGVLSVLVLLISCHQTEKKYYPNGQLWLLYERVPDISRQKVTEYDTKGNVISITFDNLNHQIDSIGRYYYDNGNLKAIINFINGQKEGEAKWYYPSGQLKETAYFINDQISDEHDFYNEDGYLVRTAFYKIVNHLSRLNGILVYDKDESVIHQESEYAEIIAEPDTLCIDGYVEYKIGWVCSTDTYVRALTGNIDHNFNVTDSSSLRLVDLDNINKFYLSEKEDTLRVIFEVKQEKNGRVYMERFYLDKVFHAGSITYTIDQR
jgi:hypothetical protein